MAGKKSAKPIPGIVVERMAKYYRVVRRLEYEGVCSISSQKLAEELSVNASQVRQDFSWFGSFGCPGRGYDIGLLRCSIEEILGFNMHYHIIVVGVGRMGETLLQNFKFDNAGCIVCAALDSDTAKCGRKIRDVPIFTMDKLPEVMQLYRPDIAVLAVPAKNAQSAAKAIIAAGIRSIWNLTNVDLQDIPESVTVQDLHMVDSLLLLTATLKSETNP